MKTKEKALEAVPATKEETAEFGYYSKLLGKPFDTLDELREAEKAKRDEIKKQEELSSKKRERAKEIEDAYKHSMEVRKKAQEMIREADDAYYNLRDEFIKDYGSFHMTYSSNSTEDPIVRASDLLEDVARFLIW